jgi:serine/threonine protein kinase
MADPFDLLFDEPLRSSAPSFIGRELGTVVVQELLSERPTCDVYAGLDTKLRRRVALKILKNLSDENMQSSQRFTREGQIMAKLRHPGIVQLLGLAQIDEYPCLIMEYIDGGCLEQALQTARPSIEDAVDVLLRIALAVASAHQLGIIHRDLKPSNILLDHSINDPSFTTRMGFIKVADFGISRLIDNFEDLTRTGVQPGTILYMAPEQVEARSSDIGTASDVFALGALLHQMVVGKSPFAAPSFAESVERIIGEDIPPLSVFRPGVPPWLDQICSKCLQKTPAARYRDAGLLAEDILRYRQTTSTQVISRNLVLLAIAVAVLVFSLLGRMVR